MGKIHSATLLMVALALPGTVVSCGPGAWFSEWEGLATEGFATHRVVGDDDAGKIWLAVSREDPLFNPNGDNEAPTYEVFSLDLQSLEAEHVATDIKSLATGIRANSGYVAWSSWPEGDVFVRDLRAQEVSKVSSGVYTETFFYPPVVALDGDRLVVHRATPVEHDDGPTQYDFVIFDLSTGSELTVSDVWLYQTIALDGNYAVFMHDKDIDVSLLGLELGAHVDVVDLTTGDRETVARNIRVPGDGGAVFADGGQFLWEQFKEGGFRSKVRSYDPATGQVATLIEELDPGTSTTVRMVDVNNEELLIERREDQVLFSQSTTFQLRRPDGKTNDLVRFTDSLLGLSSEKAHPCVVAGYVVWTDPYAGDLVIYDSATETTRHYDPLSLRNRD